MKNPLIRGPWVLILGVVGSTGLLWGNFAGIFDSKNEEASNKLTSIEKYAVAPTGKIWEAPDTASIPANEAGDLIRYGGELVAHTAVYLGPKGRIRAISNGMNCQNCHLNAGTVPFGNNYGAVASKYPIFRNRSGTIVIFEKRFNDCL